MSAPINYHPTYKKEIIYPNIDKWMQENDMYIVDLAASADMAHSYTCDLLHGKTLPKMRTIREILDVTKMSFEDAFYNPNEVVTAKVHDKKKVIATNWDTYWPEITKYFLQNNFNNQDVARILYCSSGAVVNNFVKTHSSEPNISYIHIKRLLVATNDTFEHLFRVA